MNINPKVTLQRVCDAVQNAQVSLDNPGFCRECGAEAEGVEPDAWDYKCEVCG